MAIGVLRETGGVVPPDTTGLVSTGSTQVVNWVTAHDDVEASASSAAELIRPLSVTSANVHAVKVPPGATRVMVRVRWTAAGAVTTSPIIRGYGVFGTINSPTATTLPNWFADDGTVTVVRIDRNATGAGGVTVTLDATNDLRDTTYSYSANAIHTDDGTPWFDCKGAPYVFFLCSTAGNVAGAQTAVLQVAFLN